MRVPLRVSKIIKSGGIGILPTDTLYGLVGQALEKKTVERIYTVRKRNPKKPLIILISDIKDLSRFGIALSPKEKNIFTTLWQQPVSVIFPCDQKRFWYLHRGSKSLAFRMPKNKWLKAFILKTGPLVAPSANPEGLTPACTMNEAFNYFGDDIDFYLDGGVLNKKPSTIIRFKKGSFVLERKGATSEQFIRSIFN